LEIDAEHWEFMPILSRKVSRKAILTAPGAALLLQALSMSAQADVQVSGETGAMRIVASGASLGEVLDALGTQYGVQSQLPPSLDRSISGTYDGSLAQLLSRLLQGYNFVVESTASGTKVVVYDLNAAQSGINISRNSLSNQGANPPRPPPGWNPNHLPPGFPPVPGLDPAHGGRGHGPPIGR
jgi:hypothetical protein